MVTKDFAAGHGGVFGSSFGVFSFGVWGVWGLIMGVGWCWGLGIQGVGSGSLS